MTTAPYGAMNPNSRHQLWSRWRFRVFGNAKPLREVELNSGRWLRKGFGSVGRARVRERVFRGLAVYEIEAEVEGAPAHDPGYVASVEQMFSRFVESGWGMLAVGRVKVEVLAGDVQDGRPAAQLVVIPRIRWDD